MKTEANIKQANIMKRQGAAEAPGWLDAKGVHRRFNLTPTPLRNLRLTGCIESAAVRLPGATFGKRLYNVASIEAYIAKCAEAERKGGAA